MRNRLLGLCIALLLCAVILPVQAGTKKKDNSDPDSSVATLTAVDASNNKVTITVQDSKQSTTYDMQLGSTLTIDGSPATMSQIHSGMTVLSYTEADSSSLSELDVSSKAAPAPPSDKKKK